MEMCDFNYEAVKNILNNDFSILKNPATNKHKVPPLEMGCLDGLTNDEISHRVRFVIHDVYRNAWTQAYETSRTARINEYRLPTDLYMMLIKKRLIFPGVYNWKAFTKFCNSENFIIDKTEEGKFTFTVTSICHDFGCPYRHAVSFGLEEPEAFNGTPYGITLSVANFGDYEFTMTTISRNTLETYSNLLVSGASPNVLMDTNSYDDDNLPIDQNRIVNELKKYCSGNSTLCNIRTIHIALFDYMIRMNDVYEYVISNRIRSTVRWLAHRRE